MAHIPKRVRELKTVRGEIALAPTPVPVSRVAR
jgi:hypothetical protein